LFTSAITGSSAKNAVINGDDMFDDLQISKNDILIIRFSESTNTPGGLGIQNKNGVDEIFEFEDGSGNKIIPGKEYEGQWTNPSTFKIKILKVDENLSIYPVTGEATVSVKSSANLKNSQETSPNSTSKSNLLKGSYSPFSVTKKVEPDGSASTVLPSGLIVEISIPSGSERVSISRSIPETFGKILLGHSIDIITEEDACENPCTLSFTFTDDDLKSKGVSLKNLIILHDVNKDNNFFGVDEILKPIIIPSESPGPYTASVKISQTSNFAIGQERRGGGGGDETPPVFNSFEAVTCTPEIGCGTHFVKEITFENKMPLAKLPVGHSSVLTLNVYENSGPSSLQHVTMYMNLHGYGKYIQDSDTYIRFDKGNPITIKDPHGFFSDAKITMIPRSGYVSVNFYLTFDKQMEPTDVIIRAWDVSRNSRDATFRDAITAVDMNLPQSEILQFTPQESEIPKEPSDILSVPGDIIAKWAGYSSEVITDDELLNQLQIEGTTIPSWYKKHVSQWVYDGKISQIDFVNALRFLSDGGMLS